MYKTDNRVNKQVNKPENEMQTATATHCNLQPAVSNIHEWGDYTGKQLQVLESLFDLLIAHPEDVHYLSPGSMDKHDYALYKRAWKAFGRHRMSYWNAIDAMVKKHRKTINVVFGKRITASTIYHCATKEGVESLADKLFSIFIDHTDDLIYMHGREWSDYLGRPNIRVEHSAYFN